MPVTAVRLTRSRSADGGLMVRLDDEREYRSLREAFAAQAEPMLGLGIDVIIPAGGYPMLLFAREPSFAIGAATVLNGLPVTVAAAETAIRLSQLNGTGTSRRTAYALPPGQAVTEFRSAFTTARSEEPSHRGGIPWLRSPPRLADRLDDFSALVRLRTSVGLERRIPREWARSVCG